MSRRYLTPTTVGAPCPAGPPGAVGVTVATADGHMELAKEAVKRWTEFTGLPGIIVQAPAGCGYWAKYDLAELFPGRKVCYFDADLWMCRKPDMTELWAPGYDVQAVQDCAINRPTDFPCMDIERFLLKRDAYFNTGWFTMDTRRPGPALWLAHARKLTQWVATGHMRATVDKTEQTLLNVAAQRMEDVEAPQLKVQLLSPRWNFLKIGHVHGTVKLPPQVWNAHAAGYGLPRKREVLEAMCQTFEAGPEAAVSVWAEPEPKSKSTPALIKV